MLLVVLTLPLVSCDSGGSSGEDTPEWAGTWKGISEEAVSYIEIDRNKALTVDKEFETECSVDVSDVLEVDGSTVTIDIDEGISKVDLDVSGDILEVTTIEDDSCADCKGEKLIFERVQGDPRDLAGCAE
jgi:hypothetical protein